MRVFIDTAPFIYLLQEHPHFSKSVTYFLADRISSGDEIFTSVLSIMEFGVKPMMEGKPEINRQFEEFIERTGIVEVVIDTAIAKKAYQLRSKYWGLKTIDCLQLAAALIHNCQIFFTNDKQLKQVAEIQVLILEDIQN
ncbi:MAG TPA: PIN domain-containing protein [Saprospiraceae bacterium]|nr:PIN domain-containing protein [Saprospiraceae bacterium]